MIEGGEIFHYATIGLVVGMTSIGVGIGEGLTGVAALEASNIQPQARGEINKTAMFAMALIETAAIIGLLISFMLLVENLEGRTFYAHFSQLGIAFALCLPGFVLGIVSAAPAQEACYAIARQPFFTQKILRFMLITQSVLQTPIIFGLIVTMFIKSQAVSALTMTDSLRLIASGMSIGLGSIGPAFALSHFARTACKGIGINRNAYGTLFSFTMFSQAIIETPVIFAFIISILLLIMNIDTTSEWKGIAFFASALCIGLGTIGPGISSGRVAAAACEQIAYHPENDSAIRRASFLGQSIIDTSAMYALLIAILILFA